jgi:hypothetical protein
MIGYPRDLVGYADQPPDPRWPGGARLALNFVVNYEEVASSACCTATDDGMWPAVIVGPIGQLIVVRRRCHKGILLLNDKAPCIRAGRADEGEQTPKMMTVALHCRLAGKPARAPPHLPVSSITFCATTGSGSADATRSLSIGGASTRRPEGKDERTCYL